MRWSAAALVLLLAWLPGVARGAPTSAVPAITAPEAIVIDGWTGRVLYARNANAPRDPASTVKIMTALVLLRHRVPMQRVVTVSTLAAEYGGSTAGLFAGERMTVWNLLHGMLLPSGNDAAVALSETLAPTPGQFALLMNAEARRLHMWHTRYLTANGFDTAGQLTTARDLATVARAAMHWSIFRRIVRTRFWVARSADGQVTHTWSNLNRLLWQSSAVDGIKTGTTPLAGACLVSSVRKDGRWVIEVNMGSTEADRFHDGMLLLTYGFPLASTLPTAR